MALVSSQPPTEMTSRDTSWGGKGDQCIPLTLSPSCADCLSLLEPIGPVQALTWIVLPFYVNRLVTVSRNMKIIAVGLNIM